MSNTSAPEMTIFIDESGVTPSEPKFLKRHYRHQSWYKHWKIAEIFNERYDTEVGGMERYVVQQIDHKESLDENEVDALAMEPEGGLRKRSPIILDYKKNRHYTLKEAEALPELAEVVSRLKVRIARYEAHMKRMEEPESVPSLKDLGYNASHAKELEAMAETMKTSDMDISGTIVSIKPQTQSVNYQTLEEFREDIVNHMTRDRKTKKGLKKGIAIMLAVAVVEAIAWMYGLIHIALAGLTVAVMVGCSLHSVRLIRFCRERLAESTQNLAYVEGRIQEQARTERGG